MMDNKNISPNAMKTPFRTLASLSDHAPRNATLGLYSKYPETLTT
jgi:hypothetical protein